jgi:hypothetical protein
LLHFVRNDGKVVVNYGSINNVRAAHAKLAMRAAAATSAPPKRNAKAK